MSVFPLRRAIERLRTGLFDTVAVNLLTIEEEPLIRGFSKDLEAMEKGKPVHLCISGSYGQGKSHNLTYLRQKALSAGYATSLVQLDLREIPLHRFSVVYQTLMKQLTLPSGETFVQAWKRCGSTLSFEAPHRFYMILKGLLSQKGKKEFSDWLEEALMGGCLSNATLKQILKAKGVEGYQKQSLMCRGNAPYIEMVYSLGKLLKEMGYKGLVLFFDEAESVAQVSLTSRAKSYEILHQFFQGSQGVYPIFAFTESFFDKVNQEAYESEKKPFSCNYAEAWKNLNIIRLQESASSRWETLQNQLIQLYAEAYQIDLSHQIAKIKEKMQLLLEKFKAQEMRFKLKALVHELDIETQECLR